MIDEDPSIGAFTPARGGQTTLAEIASSAYESQRRVENINSSFKWSEDAFDREIDAIKGAVGVELPNPYRVSPTILHTDPEAQQRALKRNPFTEYMAEKTRLAEEFPDHLDTIKPDRSPRDDALERARKAEHEFQDVFERGPAGWRWGAALAGSFRGSFEDPANVAGLALGPFGSAGAGARGVLWMGIKQAVANMLFEAASQPIVQRWRRDAGLDHGLQQAALNTAFAGAFGFGVDAGVRGAFRGAQRLRGLKPKLDDDGGVIGWERPRSDEAMDALDAAARRAPEGSTLRRAADGDRGALEELAREAGIADTPEARGALRAMSLEDGLQERVPGADDGEGISSLAQALRAATDDEEPPARGVDPLAPERGPVLADDAGEITDAALLANHRLALADLEARRVDPDLQEHHRRMIRQLEERVRTLEDLPEGRPLARRGESFDMDGKPVTMRGIAARDIATEPETFQFKRESASARRLLGVKQWDTAAAGRVMVYEYGDGRLVVADGHQRLALAKRLEGEGHQPVELDAIVFRETDGWVPDDVRALAAKRNLQEGTGSVIDVAKIQRERPDIIDRTVPISSDAMRQSRNLARLSDEAFAMVEAGSVRPNHAAVVGHLVDDRSRHAEIVDALAKAKPANIREARLMVGDLLQTGHHYDAQRAILGVDAISADLLKPRSQVLDHALRLLKEDANIFGLISTEATRIEQLGNRLRIDANAERALQSEAVGSLMETLAARPGPVSDWLTEAARQVAEGKRPREVAEAFVETVRSVLENEGLDGLRVRARPPLRGEGLDDPGGPEARAQVEELQRDLEADLRSAAADIANRNLDRWLWWQSVNNRDVPALTLEQRSAIVRRMAEGEDISTAFDDVVVRGETRAAEQAPEEIAGPGEELFVDQISGETFRPADVEAVVDMWRFVQEMRRAKPPQRLSSFLVDRGGINDEGGDVRHIIGRPKDRPGLINRRGMSLDDAAHLAWERGYLRTDERPTINDLLDALDEDLAGNHVYSVIDEEIANHFRAADELDHELTKIGILHAKNEADVRRQFLALLGEDATRESGEGAPGRAAPPRRTSEEDELGDLDEDAPFALAAPEAAAQRRVFDELGFYSAALEAARSWRQTKGTPAQIRQHLKASGVKDAEIRATGLDAFLQKAGASVSREDVIRHLEANRVKLNEITFGIDAGYDNRVLARRVIERADAYKGAERREMIRIARTIAGREEFDSVYDVKFVVPQAFDELAKSEAVRNEVRAIITDLQSRHRRTGRPGELVPRFREYGIDVSNPTYAETVVHLPRAVDRLEAEREAFLAGLYGKYGTNFLSRENLSPDERAQLKEIEGKLAGNEDFTFGHFPQAPNPVGHIRHALQKDATGAPVLLIDELQFDFAQYVRDRARDHHAERLFSKPFRRLTKAERAEVSKAMAQEPSSVTIASRKAEMIEARHADLMQVMQDAWAVRDKLRKATAGTGAEISPPFNSRLMIISDDQRAMLLGKVSAGKRKAVSRLVDENNTIAERWSNAEFVLDLARKEPLAHPLVETTSQAIETMLKRAVRIAIDAGAEKIAFTPGAIQALRFPDGTRLATGLRYNSRRNALMVKRRGSSTWTLWRNSDGKIADVAPDDLPRLIGADLADRLLRQTPIDDPARGSGLHQITRLRDAVVGGTGFRATYDQIYPRALLKILRKIDPAVAQVSEGLFSSLDGRPLRMASADQRRPGEPVSFHTFRLTDGVKEHVVGEGLPMFALSPDLRSRMEFDQRLASAGSAEVSPDVIQSTHAALAPLGADLPEGWRVAALKAVRPIRSSNPADAGKHVVTYVLPDGGEARFKVRWDRIANARAYADSNNKLLVALRFATSDVEGGQLHVAGQVGDRLGERGIVLFDRSLRGEFWHELLHIRRRISGGDALADSFGRIFSHAEGLGVLDMTHGEYMRSIGRPGYGEGTPDMPMRELYRNKYSTRPDVQELIAEESGAHLVELLEHGAIRVADVEPIIDDLRAVFGRVPGDRAVERMPVADVLAPLERAQFMERHGATPRTIRAATGLQRDSSGQWQGEGRPVLPIEADVISGRVDAVIGRPELFAAYPSLRAFQLRLELRRGEPEAAIDFAARQITAVAETPEAAVRKIAGAVRSEAQRSVRLTAGSVPAGMASLSRRIVDDIDDEAARLIERVGVLEGRLSSLDAILHGEHPEVAALRRRLDVLQAERKVWSGSMLQPLPRDPAVPSLLLRRPGARVQPEELATRLSRSADDVWESGANAGQVADAIRHEFGVDIDAATLARHAAWDALRGGNREIGDLIGDVSARAVDGGEISDPITALTRADIENLGPAEMAALLRERGRAGVPERLRSFEESSRLGLLKDAVEACRS